MGLDMYLTRHTYTKNWDYTPEDKKLEISIKQNGKEFGIIDPRKITYIIEEVGYWRKANQIHRFFVERCQDGVDDCKEYYVPIETLEELFGLCKRVLKNPSKAEELLPVQEGFFFGSTAYDSYYFENIKYTINVIESILNHKRSEMQFYYYESSW